MPAGPVELNWGCRAGSHNAACILPLHTCCLTHNRRCPPAGSARRPPPDRPRTWPPRRPARSFRGGAAGWRRAPRRGAGGSRPVLLRAQQPCGAGLLPGPLRGLLLGVCVARLPNAASARRARVAQVRAQRACRAAASCGRRRLPAVCSTVSPPHRSSLPLRTHPRRYTGTAAALACLALFLAVSWSDPGTVTPVNAAAHAALYPHDGVLYPERKQCATCCLPRPARSKHCRVCNK